MEKLEVCKKLMRLVWMSQAAIDNRKSIEQGRHCSPIPNGICLEQSIHSIIMDKIWWNFCDRDWGALHSEYNAIRARVKDIA